MAAKARMLDPVADLHRRLARRQPGRSGGGGRGTRTIVLRWWSDHELAEHPATVGKRIARALLEHATVDRLRTPSDRHRKPAGSAAGAADGQLAGIVVLGELLADHLRATDLPVFADLLASGRITDGDIVDAFGVKVLGTLLHRVRGRADVSRALAQWRTATSPAQRRAACVAFTALAPQGDGALPGLTQLIFTLCSTVVWSPERSDQTAVAWLLRELSRAEPTRVEAFVRRHARFMSRECVRHAVDRLPPARQQDLLAHWKRSTTLRR